MTMLATFLPVDAGCLLAQADAGEVGMLQLVARIVHLLSAIALGGVVFYLLLVYLPARRTMTPEQIAANHAALRARLAALIGLTAALLLVTGLTTYMLNVRQFKLEQGYHMLFGVKFLLALLVFFVMSLIAGRTAAAERFREKLSLWLTLSALAIVALVIIGSVMRFAPRPPKPPEPAAAQASPAESGVHSAASRRPGGAPD